MAEFPFMRLFWGDYFGDTRHLETAEEHGAYLLLLGECWRGGGELPADDKLLARLACCTPERWAAIKGTILAFFTQEKGKRNIFTHKRVCKELEAAHSKSEKASESALTRWGKRKNGDMRSHSGRNAKAMQTQSVRYANQNHIKKPPISPENSAAEEPQDELDFALEGEELKADPFAEFWRVYPRKVGKADAERKFRAAVKAGTPASRIIAAAEAYAADCRAKGTDPGFIAHPGTWLNKGRHLDTSLPPSQANGSASRKPCLLDQLPGDGEKRWRWQTEMIERAVDLKAYPPGSEAFRRKAAFLDQQIAARYPDGEKWPGLVKEHFAAYDAFHR